MLLKAIYSRNKIIIIFVIMFHLISVSYSDYVEIPVPKTIEVFLAIDNYACSENICHKITNYKVKTPDHYNCENEGLPIKYSITGPELTEFDATGFIKPYIQNGVDGRILEKQYTSKCQYIRRFFY